MDLNQFTPWSALAGGALIGLSASLLLFSIGRIAGISGILGGVLRPQPGEARWRAWFLSGLLASGALFAWLSPESITPSPRSLSAVLAAGLLVGIGTRLGNGCTSGHGVCGLSRLAPRSFVATITFIGTGVVTVLVTRLLGGAQ